jgi:anti-sigma regulatory factor (Ser/Thr protein kinase)
VSDEITLTLPAQEDFRHVAHLVVGGLAARRDVTYEHLEDLQVAFDAILGCRDDDGEITISLCVEDGEVRADIGPFSADALAQLDRGSSELRLRRVLDTVCDNVTIEERGASSWVELTKKIAA